MSWNIGGESRDYRLKITMDHTQVSETDTDITITFRLNRIPGAHGFWSHVKSDGGDIIVTKSDGTTRVPLEVADVNIAGNWGNIYFKGDKSSVSDVEFYIYYGDAGASQPGRATAYGKENAWPDHTSVYHMNVDAASQDDATSTDIDLILHEDGSYPQTLVTGSGPFDRFLSKGILTYWDISNTVHNNVANLSIEIWTYVNNWGGTWKRLYNKGSTAYEMGRYMGENRTRLIMAGTSTLNSVGDFLEDQWYYIATVFKNADYVRQIFDGVQSSSAATAATATGSNSTPNYVMAEGGTGQIDGDIAELRYAEAAFTNNYYADQHEMVENYATFWSGVGSEEENTRVPDLMFAVCGM